MCRAIEDNIRATCGDLIEECIVVGTGRPSPALFVEPAPGVDYGKLKRDIIRKTRQFHSRRYLHEQITNPKLIMVVPSGSLPRTATKGNIRRKAVEEAYQAELDKIYASLQ
jgi:acyl-CoA synthetase (AMP-forming)/AMP-acid ligase II